MKLELCLLGFLRKCNNCYEIVKRSNGLNLALFGFLKNECKSRSYQAFRHLIVKHQVTCTITWHEENPFQLLMMSWNIWIHLQLNLNWECPSWLDSNTERWCKTFFAEVLKAETLNFLLFKLHNTMFMLPNPSWHFLNN